MERTKSKQKWRKIGGGVFRIGNRTIHPGEVFFADPSEIPQSFRNIIQPVGPMPAEEPPISVLPVFEIIHLGMGWYDIVNIETRKAMNEKKLRLSAAEMMLKSL